MSQRRWDEVRHDLSNLVFRDGVSIEEVARRTHVNRSTVYRLINGDTQRPNGPTRAAVESVVANATPKEGKVGG
jgi:transposase-like protein